eukprot:1522299-Amphidinium_carterae.2
MAGGWVVRSQALPPLGQALQLETGRHLGHFMELCQQHEVREHVFNSLHPVHPMQATPAQCMLGIPACFFSTPLLLPPAHALLPQLQRHQEGNPTNRSSLMIS